MNEALEIKKEPNNYYFIVTNGKKWEKRTNLIEISCEEIETETQKRKALIDYTLKWQDCTASYIKTKKNPETGEKEVEKMAGFEWLTVEVERYNNNHPTKKWVSWIYKRKKKTKQLL